MVKNALGLIEVVGLAAGLEAADAAVKAANVELIGYELAKGGGMVVIKLCGDVGAVKAAVDAGSTAAAKINKVVAKHVIPRPHNEVGGLIITKETVGHEPVQPAAADVEPQEAQTEPSAETIIPAEPQEASVSAGQTAEITVINEADTEIGQEPVQEAANQEPANSPEICNLCGDPACPRKKGDPRVTCIHYEKNYKEDE